MNAVDMCVDAIFHSQLPTNQISCVCVCCEREFDCIRFERLQQHSMLLSYLDAILIVPKQNTTKVQIRKKTYACDNSKVLGLNFVSFFSLFLPHTQTQQSF